MRQIHEVCAILPGAGKVLRKCEFYLPPPCLYSFIVPSGLFMVCLRAGPPSPRRVSLASAERAVSAWFLSSYLVLMSLLGSLFRLLLPSPGDNRDQAWGEPINTHFREALGQSVLVW